MKPFSMHSNFELPVSHLISKELIVFTHIPRMMLKTAQNHGARLANYNVELACITQNLIVSYFQNPPKYKSTKVQI